MKVLNWKKLLAPSNHTVISVLHTVTDSKLTKKINKKYRIKSIQIIFNSGNLAHNARAHTYTHTTKHTTKHRTNTEDRYT